MKFTKQDQPRRSSIKKGVLKNFPKFAENTCIGVSFLEPHNFIEKPDPKTGVFL